jgi:hypothetical protein
VKLSERSALTRVQSFISEISGGLTLFSFSQKCKLSTGFTQGVHRLSKFLDFLNLRICLKTTTAGSALSRRTSIL